MRGGRRLGAGRPRGSRSTRPAEFLLTKPMVTNVMLVAQGEPPLEGPDALSFLQNGYRNRNLPEQFRAYCANAALSYERVKPVTVGARSVDEIREEIRREIHKEQHREDEEAREKLMHNIRRLREATPPSERVRRALTGALTGEDDQLSEADRALIDDIVARVVEVHPVDRQISEIALPPPPPVVVRKRPDVDCELMQHDCDTSVQATENIGNTRRDADY